MFIDENEAKSRVRGLETITKNSRGRTLGATEIPEFLRPIIGASDRLSGAPKTARAFGIGIATAYSHGEGRRGNPTSAKDPELESKIEGRIQTVQEKALDKLMVALNLLDEEMMQSKTGVGVSTIAANMGRIVEKTAAKQNGAGSGTQIVIYAPQMRTENRYDVIEA